MNEETTPPTKIHRAERTKTLAKPNRERKPVDSRILEAQSLPPAKPTIFPAGHQHGSNAPAADGFHPVK
jgi:hypothetical protein